MGDVNENKTVFISAVVNLEVLSVAVLKLLGIEICTKKSILHYPFK